MKSLVWGSFGVQLQDCRDTGAKVHFLVEG